MSPTAGLAKESPEATCWPLTKCLMVLINLFYSLILQEGTYNGFASQPLRPTRIMLKNDFLGQANLPDLIPEHDHWTGLFGNMGIAELARRNQGNLLVS